MALLNFDSSQVAPQEAFEAIPAGWYVAQMSASEMTPTKDNTGAFLKCEFTILAPQDFANRKIFDRLNLQNNNAQAVEIAYRQLSAICHSIGVIQVQDSAQLHGRPLQVKVSVRAAGVGADGVMREATNEVKGYKAIDGAAPASAPTYTPPPPPTAYAPPPPPQAWTPPPQPAQAPVAPPPPQQAPTWQQPPAQPAPAPQAPAQTPPWQQQTPAASQPGASVPPWAKPA